MQLVPKDADLARETRLLDCFYGLYVQEPMQKIVGDRLRPSGKSDPYGVEQAKALLRTAYARIDREMGTKEWAMSYGFSMADCAAAPALYYANLVLPFEARTRTRRPTCADSNSVRPSRACSKRRSRTSRSFRNRTQVATEMPVVFAALRATAR